MRRFPRRCPGAASRCSNSLCDPSVKGVSGKAFAKAVERQGWTLLRIAGSHHIFGKSGEVARLSIPIHGNQPLKLGLQRALMKLAGVEENDL
jgi:predicted RNA binding protein YcfA (HicA-like mRNA interferase family)